MNDQKKKWAIEIKAPSSKYRDRIILYDIKNNQISKSEFEKQTKLNFADILRSYQPHIEEIKAVKQDNKWIKLKSKFPDATLETWHVHPNGGGWVQNTARVAESAYVGPDAIVSGNAQVAGHARVLGNAEVLGNARVFGYARVSENARVYGNAQVGEIAQVLGYARVSEIAQVFGYARVCGNAQVFGYARVSGDAWVTGNAQVFGDTQISGEEIVEK